MSALTTEKTVCFHCGEPCRTDRVEAGDKSFCCEGCRMVYQLLDQGGLGDYYRLNENPGVNRKEAVRKDKFAFLEEDAIVRKLIRFQDEEQSHVVFYLPKIHCSSCLYLLEHLHQLDRGIILSRVDFGAREATILFDHRKIPLRGVAELLAAIGYEPYISLRDMDRVRPRAPRRDIYQLGVAGFCFGNIMLLSFPEYLGLDKTEGGLQVFFRACSFLLSIPVLFYSARPFFRSAWKSGRAGWLNIDAPIALAILVTWCRSVWEVGSGTGSGYFDSMSGIVFFMLAGRALQDRTYRQLTFDRDYTSYFPIAVTVIPPAGGGANPGAPVTKALPELRCGDTLLIHHDELIPADSLLTRGHALIDYSFVTGESVPVIKETGELLYAGGRQKGASIEVLVVREVAQSYLTSLWERQEKPEEEEVAAGGGYTDAISKYFTWIVFSVAAMAALYWWREDPARIWNAVTAVLIIACPCALLLSSTFTNGNILRILAANRFYLRSARTIERIGGIDRIVFDKTGTLTFAGMREPEYTGMVLTEEMQRAIATLVASSTHPLSRALARHFGPVQSCELLGFQELPGKGIHGYVNGKWMQAGSREWVCGASSGKATHTDTRVYLSCEGELWGYFRFSSRYREGLRYMVRSLEEKYRITVLSGDQPGEQQSLRTLLGAGPEMYFQQSPHDKAAYIRSRQQAGERVLMVGDGLNDAGALRQSDAGIALSEESNQFTPASDAILESGQLISLPRFVALCKANRKIILASFIVSILYNIVGLFFAVQGHLSPMIAAILMPLSSLSILLITYGSSALAARFLRL